MRETNSQQAQALQQRRWRPVEVYAGHMANVIEVLAPDGRGVETAGSQVAIEREKACGDAQSGRRARFVADGIADSALLNDLEVRESLAKSPRGLRLQPGETVQDYGSILQVQRIGRTDPLIDEVDDSHGRGARRVRVGRNYEVRQKPRQPSLWR